ncbi:hypothetical protein BU24DRAFT_83233 [Aaosphaeria arxii CBS 175.79]|uniref:Uncharacterized protein n=1 Tax=Aaosphaeria arxii CBS 175.79 TaxID=1450172 RepID=A0A6A5X891_9PLEO|nr:uncharacterized protein BU24DRAFT_83233 [Aaosphaeria arxii CBS 175.79]KAF2009163.1 hypothetical protein BU24DRAFT_83233 [Aaosphaeria arxii CBS 175.79]
MNCIDRNIAQRPAHKALNLHAATGNTSYVSYMLWPTMSYLSHREIRHMALAKNAIVADNVSNPANEGEEEANYTIEIQCAQQPPSTFIKTIQVCFSIVPWSRLVRRLFCRIQINETNRGCNHCSADVGFVSFHESIGGVMISATARSTHVT